MLILHFQLMLLQPQNWCCNQQLHFCIRNGQNIHLLLFLCSGATATRIVLIKPDGSLVAEADIALGTNQWVSGTYASILCRVHHSFIIFLRAAVWFGRVCETNSSAGI
jgi:hypothetical protein